MQNTTYNVDSHEVSGSLLTSPIIIWLHSFRDLVLLLWFREPDTCRALLPTAQATSLNMARATSPMMLLRLC